MKNPTMSMKSARRDDMPIMRAIRFIAGGGGGLVSVSAGERIVVVLYVAAMKNGDGGEESLKVCE